MEVTLGIDIGGSTTKIAALLDRKQLLASLQVETPDQITSLYGAVGKLLYENSLPLEQISEIVLTGVGSTHIREDIYGIPTYKVDEFSAIGCGGLTLCGLKEATVVSMGTGTAFVRAERSGYRHLGGSGVGGGTLAGLSRQLLNETQVSAAAELAERGNLSQVDLLVGDISAGSVASLSPKSLRQTLENCIPMPQRLIWQRDWSIWSSRRSAFWLVFPVSTGRIKPSPLWEPSPHSLPQNGFWKKWDPCTERHS